jgi:tocopherol O-methyltransferase
MRKDFTSKESKVPVSNGCAQRIRNGFITPPHRPEAPLPPARTLPVLGNAHCGGRIGPLSENPYPEALVQPSVANPRANEKHKIIEHYDVVSPYYYSLWGEHIHHGYWIRGDESKETAQIQLIDHLAELANIKTGSRILDIGCGFGGSSLYLAKKYRASITGITISPVQVQMAREAAAKTNLDASFFLMDAEDMQFSQQFDLLWSVESISHYYDPRKFFASAVKFLKPGGCFALTDWFQKENLSPAEKKIFIHPIEKGMMVELRGMNDYSDFLVSIDLHIVHRQDLTLNCAKSWDLGLDIIKDKKVWMVAAKHGAEFVRNLKSFRAMRAGFESGNFVYGLFVARLPENDSNRV